MTISVNNLINHINMSTYNVSFAFDDKIGNGIDLIKAREILAHGMISLIQNYEQTELSNIISHIEHDKDFDINFSMEKSSKKIYLIPSFNSTSISALKSEFTCLIANISGKFHPHGIVIITDKARRSALIGVRIEKEKEKVPGKIIRDVDDVESVAYFSGIIAANGKIKFYPREYTRRGEKMVSKRGKGESFKTTTTFELVDEVVLDKKEIRNKFLPYFTPQASEDKQIMSCKSNFLLSWKSECASLSNSIGLGEDFQKLLDRTEAYERAQEALPPEKRNQSSSIFVMEMKEFKDKIKEKIIMSPELNQIIKDEYSIKFNTNLTRNESESILQEYFQKGLKGEKIT